MLDDHGVYPVRAPRKPATMARLKAMARQLEASGELIDHCEYKGERALKPILIALARRSLNADGFAELTSMIA